MFFRELSIKKNVFGIFQANTNPDEQSRNRDCQKFAIQVSGLSLMIHSIHTYNHV